MNLKVYLEGVEVKTYYFTPNSDGYFVAETTGNLDTRLKISSSSGLFIINDDGGINNNSRIYFKAEKGVQITIDVRLYEDYSSDDASSGYIELQLRKQRFSMFSYVDANGNNLIENLEKPNNLFKNLFECSKYQNEHASIANSFDSTNISVVNSEIMFFYGHGYSDGHGVVFYDHSVNRGSWTLDSFINLNRIRVAVWAACDSANSSNSRNISFAENSVINWGASSAVGFEKTVSISSASKFTDKFFEKLASGATVDESAKAGAGAVFWAWDAVKSYKVFGYGGFSD